MLKLKYANIDGDEIHFYRSKTLHTSKEKKEIEALLTPEMKQIIEKWGNSEKNPNNFVFPFLTGNETPLEQKKRIQDITRRINKHVKKIGDKLGIEKEENIIHDAALAPEWISKIIQKNISNE